MKQKDIMLIAVIVVVSGVLSFFLSNLVIGTPQKSGLKVEVVEPITSDFPTPDNKYFNEKSINPTQVITIDATNNPQPFND